MKKKLLENKFKMKILTKMCFILQSFGENNNKLINIG